MTDRTEEDGSGFGSGSYGAGRYGVGDISGGAPTSEQKTKSREALSWEQWKFRWTNWLTIGIAITAAIYFAAFLLYAICAEHRLPDIPVIFALASIPTILTIALMRFFHKNEDDGSNVTFAPTQIELVEKIVSAVVDKLKGP